MKKQTSLNKRKQKNKSYENGERAMLRKLKAVINFWTSVHPKLDEKSLTVIAMRGTKPKLRQSPEYAHLKE